MNNYPGILFFLFIEHPEVMEAVADAIRYTIEKKPQDNNPLSLVADHVLASSDK